MGKGSFIAAAMIAASTAVQAQMPAIDVHGFGGSSYRKTDQNIYLGGTPNGSYSQTEFSLALGAKLTDRLKISTQGLVSEERDGAHVRTVLTYAFIEYSFADQLKLRAGQIKLPFGNYGEIVHVGTLRPFLAAPQSVYGPIGVGVGPEDKLTGIGLTGARDLSRNLQFSYDVYGGGMVMMEYAPPEQFLLGEPVTTDTSLEHESTRNVLGGRTALRFNKQGLDLGVSAYRGQEDTRASETRPRWVGSVHSQLERDRWLVRAEVAHETVTHDMKVDAGYIEAAYKLTKHWQVAAQYADMKTQIWEVTQPTVPSLLDHRENIVGLNYWFTDNAVLKASVHRIKGNRYAGPSPESYAEVIGNGTLEPKTNLLMIGIDFSF